MRGSTSDDEARETPRTFYSQSRDVDVDARRRVATPPRLTPEAHVGPNPRRSENDDGDGDRHER